MIQGGQGIESLMNGENMMNIFNTISKKIDTSDNSNIMEEALDLTKNMKIDLYFHHLCLQWDRV